MRYSIEPRDRIYKKGYGFSSFVKNMGKNLSIKYTQKLLDSAKKSTTDTIKKGSKRAIKKKVEVNGDLIGNKIADKVICVSKKSSEHSKKLENHNTNNELEVPKKDKYLLKKDNKLLMN